MLSGSRVTDDRARFIRGREDLSHLVFRKGRNKNGDVNNYLIHKNLRKQLSTGGTFVLDSIDEYHCEYGEKSQMISSLLSCPSSANLYVSYGEHEGFGSHSDDHGVIVNQLIGDKEWLIEDEVIIMSVGDWLYLPKGVSHNPICKGTNSWHVTYSVCKPTASDFISWLNNTREELLESEIYSLEDILGIFDNQAIMDEFLDFFKRKTEVSMSMRKERLFP